MLISKAMLAVRHAASTDATRYNLNGIHFRGEGVTEATNEHFLIRTSVTTPPDDEFPSVEGFDRNTDNPEALKPFILPLSGVEQLRKAIPKERHISLNHAIVDVPKTNAGGKFYAHTTDLENTQAIAVSKIDGEYPSTDQIIPDRSKQTELFCLNLVYLEKVLKAAKEFGCNKKNVKALFCVEMETDGKPGLGAISLRLENEDGDEMEAVIMPMRK